MEEHNLNNGINIWKLNWNATTLLFSLDGIWNDGLK